jgi:hypothetical protein
MIHSTADMKKVATVSSKRKACPVSMMESSRRLAGKHYQVPDYPSTDDMVNPPHRHPARGISTREGQDGPGT